MSVDQDKSDMYWELAEFGVVILGIVMIILTLCALWVDTNGF